MELAERNNDHTPPICQRDQMNGHIDSSSSPLIPPSIRIPAGKDSFRGGTLSPGPLEVPRDLKTSTHCSSQPGFAVGGSISPPTAGSTPLVDSFVPPSTITDRSTNSNDDCMVRRLEDRMGLVHVNGSFLLGEMVTNPISDAHKYPRASCGPINPSTPTKVSVCPSNVKQQDHSSCHKSAGIQESRHPKSCIVAVPQILERTPASAGVTHSGPHNVVADQLARNSPIDSEWEPAPSCFRLLEDLCGLLEVDLFATPLGHKIETFVAPFAHPRALATNTFTLDWNQFSSIYLFPPPKAIPRVLLKLIRYQDKGGLIFPKRPTAP